MIEKKEKVEIILVEDNASDAELTTRALEKNHLAEHLIHLKDGVEAIDFIFGNEESGIQLDTSLPRVILLDLKMPKLNGIEVLERLKSDEFAKQIPVVILTSSEEEPDIHKCYQLGVNSYIVKPVEYDAFTKAVGDLGMYWMMLNQCPSPEVS